MLRQFSRRRVIGMFLVDWVGTIAMLVLAVLVRSHVGAVPQPVASLLEWLSIPFFPSVNWETESAFLVPQVALLVAVVWPFFFATFSVYEGRRNATLRLELLNVFGAVCVAALALAGLLFFTYRRASRVVFLLFVALDLVLLLGVRCLWWAYRRFWRGRVPTVRQRVLIAGAGPVGRRVVEQLRQYAGSNVSVVGFVDDDAGKQGCELEGLPVLGTLADLPGVVARHGIREAVVALPLHAHERLVSVCRVLQGLSVEAHVVPDLFALSFPNATLDGYGGIPVIHLGRPGLTQWQRTWKRALDVVAGTALVVLTAPLLLLVAILIKLESRGPVFFRQERIGENAEPFTIFKFRSMYVDADDNLHKAHVSRLIEQNLSPEDLGAGKSLKMTDDPRVTRVGRFIRKTSIDELPQLFNVVRGDMSLVGPRPPIAYEVQMYQDWHLGRLQAPPGITGLWQVQGRNRVSFDEMVRMDIEYIQRQSVWLDVKILAKTWLAVLSGKGAA